MKQNVILTRLKDLVEQKESWLLSEYIDFYELNCLHCIKGRDKQFCNTSFPLCFTPNTEWSEKYQYWETK